MAACEKCERATKAARERQIASMVHELDGGRWIVAQHDRRNAQWTSSNLPGAEQSYRYSYARTLAGLVSLGIRTYATKSGARAAARRLSTPPLVFCADCDRRWRELEDEREMREAMRADAEIGR
jgi:hypothetical protein